MLPLEIRGSGTSLPVRTNNPKASARLIVVATLGMDGAHANQKVPPTAFTPPLKCYFYSVFA